ncbi:hypothetical protein [Bacillus cereus]
MKHKIHNLFKEEIYMAAFLAMVTVYATMGLPAIIAGLLGI